MRELSGETAAASQALTAAPALALRMDFPDGAAYYGESQDLLPFSLRGRLSVAQSLRLRMDSSGTLGNEEVTLRIQDEDGGIARRFAAGDFAGVRLSLLQCFSGLSAELAVTLFRGVCDTPPAWVEQTHELEISPAGLLGRLAERELLFAATKAAFPEIAAEDEGEYLPLCYGSPQRVPGVCVVQAPAAELSSTLTASMSAFYVSDASAFPQDTALLLRIDDELLTGTFHGNCCTVAARADYRLSSTFGAVTGNPALMRVLNLTPAERVLLPGQYLEATLGGATQRRLIRNVTADGLLQLQCPFLCAASVSYAQPEAGSACTILSQTAGHAAGAVVRAVNSEQVFVLRDAPGGALALLEGETEEGYAAIPPARYSYTACDTGLYPGVGRGVALVRLAVPLTALPETVFISDRVYATFQDESTNPADILAQILTERLEFAAADLDADSFAAAALARESVRMSFALAESFRVGTFLRDLCRQARLALLCEGGRIRVLTLDNGLPDAATDTTGATGSEDSGRVAMVLPPAQIRAGTLGLSPGAEGGVLAVRGTYRNGKVCARTNSGGIVCAEEVTLPLWAFASEVQARRAAEWWLQRLNRVWREVELQTFLPGLALERLDLVELSAPDLPVSGGAALQGRVVEVERLARSAPEDMDAYRVVLQCPQWSGCATSCEASCETAACESGGCELSCTATCEATCQNACEAAQQLYGVISEEGCSTTCQLNCRTSEEKACSSGCETSCESGCEISCQGESFEIVCPTGCESAAEQWPAEQTLRRVRVLTPPATPGAAAAVLNLGASGESFSAIDIADLRPAAGTESLAAQLADGSWILAGAGREAKFVRVVADAGGGVYTVIETTTEGSDWGESFTAVYPA